MQWGWNGLAAFFFDQDFSDWNYYYESVPIGTGFYTRIFLQKLVIPMNFKGSKLFTKFDRNIAQAPLIGEIFKNYSTQNVIFLEIQYSSTETKYIKDQQLYSWTRVLSEIGGQLKLFSIFCLGFYLIFKFMAYCFCVDRLEKRDSRNMNYLVKSNRAELGTPDGYHDFSRFLFT
eukprot:TRINITY_DN17433_c0_g1_i1.p1 TRINITY_DN17433_c0_g1~~TRINITY_DN17433_c0_g1_i1.p1  ORF type:complete len:174 (-),score=10.12 TRINITY_DN17433_c0_g1_i1:58-579(-)